MRRSILTLLALAVVLGPLAASADYLEVRRPAIVRDDPDRDATELLRLTEGALVLLRADGQTDGYYEVSVGVGDGSGWVYRTLVRRHAGDPPPGADVTPTTEVILPTTPSDGAAAPGALDASAFRSADCPPEGDAQVSRVRALNRIKNRLRGPAPSQITSLGLDELLFPGNDSIRWSPDYAIEVIGYVEDVKVGGVETCNCKATASADRDTHIELSVESGSAKTDRVIVEVTPAWRRFMASQGKDWSTAKLKQTILHRWVRVQGLMLFDTEHDDEAENTNPGRANNWRGTAWEIHPITALEVLPEPVP